MRIKAKSIVNSIISAAIISALLFSQGCFAVAAETAQGGSSSVFRSNAGNLTATDEELKELETFFRTFYYGADESIVPFNSKEITYNDVLNIFLTDNSGKSKLYDGYFNGAEAIDCEKIPDPMGKFGADEESEQTGFYYIYKKESIDWIITKILNASPSVVTDFNAEGYETDTCYYYDGSFYVAQRTSTDNSNLTVNVQSVSQSENGRYVADIESVSAEKSKAEASAKAVVALKEVSGNRRWTIYYAGGEDGVDEALKNAPLVITIDNNSFPNDATAFIKYAERTRYYTKSDNMEKLTANKPSNLRNAVYEYTAGGWDGAGYGIAAAMALSFAEKTDISLYQEGTGISFYKMQSPAQNNNFRSLINYYQLSQLCTFLSDYRNFDEIRDNAEVKTDVLKGLTEAVKNESPVIVVCSQKTNSKTVGHALVACGYDTKTDGSFEIMLADPDDRGKHIYLAVNADFSNCSFKGSNYGSGEIVSLGYLTAAEAQKLLETDVSQEAERLADKCIIILEQNAKLTVTNALGEKLICNENGFSGDMAYTVENYIIGGNGHESDIMLSVENSESFTVDNEGKTLDITFSGGNGIFCGVDGTNIESVNIIPNEFTVKGKDMAYSISALSTEEDVELINLRGSESREITAASKNGVTVTSERKQNLRLALVSSKGDIKECDYQPPSFEYNITATLVEERAELEKSNNLIVLLFFGIFGVLVVTAAAVTFVIVKKKRKRDAKTTE